MWLFPDIFRYRLLLALIPSLVLINACESESPAAPDTATVSAGIVSQPAGTENPQTADTASQAVTEPQQSESGQPEAPKPSGNAINPQFSVATGQYLFDVSDHSQEELVALLKRADEIAGIGSPDADELDIALIVHGPDIGWFARQNYRENKELVDLAARLDALGIIDLKICQRSMQQYGYLEDDIPAFIDRVPFAPDEMQRLEGSGYFSL